MKDDDGRLYFAAMDTEKCLLAATAVSAAWLNDVMERCRARAIVLLLDCCYSGAFVRGSKSDDGVHLKEKLAGRGRAILTASNALEYAWEGEELSGQPQPSLFTAATVEGLETGEADRDGDGVVSIIGTSTSAPADPTAPKPHCCGHWALNAPSTSPAPLPMILTARRWPGDCLLGARITVGRNVTTSRWPI